MGTAVQGTPPNHLFLSAKSSVLKIVRHTWGTQQKFAFKMLEGQELHCTWKLLTNASGTISTLGLKRDRVRHSCKNKCCEMSFPSARLQKTWVNKLDFSTFLLWQTYHMFYFAERALELWECLLQILGGATAWFFKNKNSNGKSTMEAACICLFNTHSPWQKNNTD